MAQRSKFDGAPSRTNFGNRKSHTECKVNILFAPVVELADTLDLGSSAERCAGSSPVRCIKKETAFSQFPFFIVKNFIELIILCFK